MKTNKKFLTILTLCIALLLTACGTTDAAGTDKTNESLTETGTVSTDSSNTALNDLYQQENQIFADHADVWNKVFGMMNKSTADPSGNYADYLADTVEANKDSFSEDELNTLTDDIATIRKIEEQIAEMENGSTASEDTDAKNDSEEASPFRDFSGQDYDGNTVDESLFSKNAVTVVNFWFTGCKPWDVLNDILENNDYQNIRDERENMVKTMFKDYKTLSSTMRQQLLEMGFEVTEEGKHYRLTYFGDGRYKTTIAKTGSDWREGKNIAAVILKNMM